MYKKETELFLEGVGIYVLRSIGRIVGVSQPTVKPKAILINDIINILTGNLEPYKFTLRGRPVKMGKGLFEHCEMVLEQLKSILNINENINSKTEKFQKALPLNTLRYGDKNKQLTFREHISGILSLCIEQSDLEIIASFILELSTARKINTQNNIL